MLHATKPVMLQRSLCRAAASVTTAIDGHRATFRMRLAFFLLLTRELALQYGWCNVLRTAAGTPGLRASARVAVRKPDQPTGLRPRQVAARLQRFLRCPPPAPCADCGLGDPAPAGRAGGSRHTESRKELIPQPGDEDGFEPGGRSEMAHICRGLRFSWTQSDWCSTCNCETSAVWRGSSQILAGASRGSSWLARCLASSWVH